MNTTFIIAIDPGVKNFAVAVCDTRNDLIIHVARANISRDDLSNTVDFDKLHVVLRNALNLCKTPVVVDLTSEQGNGDGDGTGGHGGHGGPPPRPDGLPHTRNDVKAIVENQFASSTHQFATIEVRGACFAFMSAFRVPASTALSITKFNVFNVKAGANRTDNKQAAKGFIDEWIARVTLPNDLLRISYWGAPDKPLPPSRHQRHDMADAMMMALAASRTQHINATATTTGHAPSGKSNKRARPATE